MVAAGRVDLSAANTTLERRTGFGVFPYQTKRGVACAGGALVHVALDSTVGPSLGDGPTLALAAPGFSGPFSQAGEPMELADGLLALICFTPSAFLCPFYTNRDSPHPRKFWRSKYVISSPEVGSDLAPPPVKRSRWASREHSRRSLLKSSNRLSNHSSLMNKHSFRRFQSRFTTLIPPRPGMGKPACE